MRRFLYCISWILIGLICRGDAYGQVQSTDENLTTFQTDSLIRVIIHIPMEPLEVMPVSDCRLDNIEKALAERYVGMEHRMPAELIRVLDAKREALNFRRTFIDSFYYIQALQAVNRPQPDYNAAMQAIEKSLLHNRFFARSVVFKMNRLLRDERNAQVCLRYLNQTLQEFSIHPKVRNAAQQTYNTLLEQTQKMVEKGLYQDALDMCHLLDVYCQDAFPLFYQTYKEDQLKNLAYQGLFRSYFDVAEKAFNQEQNQLAQKYAMQAYRFYLEHENHMAGVNYAVELLDKIAARYISFIALSDPEEKFYYQTLVDEIIRETGLEFIMHEPYDAAEDIAGDVKTMQETPQQEIQWELLAMRDYTVNEPEQDEAAIAEPVKEPVLAETEKTEPIKTTEQPITLPATEPVKTEPKPAEPAKLTAAQAKSRYQTAWEEANLLRTKRQFLPAQQNFDLALQLQTEYKLKSDPDFNEIYSQNLIATVEQLLNKAVYYLWKSDEKMSDSLQTSALQFLQAFQQLRPDDPTTQVRLQQLLSDFQNKKDENACRKLYQRFNETLAELYRQASFGNWDIFEEKIKTVRFLYQEFKTERHISCEEDSTRLTAAETLYRNWRNFRNAYQTSVDNYKQNSDIPALVDSYTSALALFDSLELGKNISAPVSLFSRLSNSKDYDGIYKWVELCLERKDFEQASFLHNYLIGQGYRSNEMEKQTRQLRKRK